MWQACSTMSSVVIAVMYCVTVCRIVYNFLTVVFIVSIIFSCSVYRFTFKKVTMPTRCTLYCIIFIPAINHAEGGVPQSRGECHGAPLRLGLPRTKLNFYYGLLGYWPVSTAPRLLGGYPVCPCALDPPPPRYKRLRGKSPAVGYGYPS